MPARAPELIRFLPSYVGSKRAWVGALERFRGRPFAELFAGSAVLSANLASHALLIDADPMVARILERFDEQVVPEKFTRDDYYRLRRDPDWWRHVYALQSMSYSGVFRYSKNGYNVPAKGGPAGTRYPMTTHVRPDYERALRRWQELDPVVVCASYLDVEVDDIRGLLGADAVVIIDPPYEGSSAAYNGAGFDYDSYWSRVAELADVFDVVLFDRLSNLEARGYPVTGVRKMRVNGARPGDQEAMSILLRAGVDAAA